MKPFFTSLVSMLLLWGCSQKSSKPITEVSQNEVNSVILVDVRTLKEYEAGHLENALNIDFFDTRFASRFDSISKDQIIYLYCKKGGRSAKAA